MKPAKDPAKQRPVPAFYTPIPGTTPVRGKGTAEPDRLATIHPKKGKRNRHYV